MSKTRIRRPVSNTRFARRSLVELTAAASRAVDDDLLVRPDNLVDASPDDPPGSEHVAKTSDRTVVARQATAPISVAVPESQNAVVSRNDELADCDTTAAMMVKIAKHHQNRVFENIKVSLNVALDHAKDFAEPRIGSEVAKKDGRDSSVKSNFLTVLEGATADFRAEVLELMKANVIATLEYARDLSGTTTVAEFVRLSSAQAPKQCELILKQAGTLKLLAQTIMKSSAE
jgi:hypothetical protein